MLKDRHAKEGPTVRQRQKKVQKEQKYPRLVARDWMFMLHNALNTSMDHGGLQHFVPLDPKRECTDPWAGPEDDNPPLLTLSGMDQESSQRAAFHFLECHCKLSIVLILALHHRKHNDVSLAIDRSSLRGVAHRRLVMSNIAYGPWKGSMYMRDFEDAGVDLVSLCEPNNPCSWLFGK